jgi:hypothetical protein
MHDIEETCRQNFPTEAFPAYTVCYCYSYYAVPVIYCTLNFDAVLYAAVALNKSSFRVDT